MTLPQNKFTGELSAEELLSLMIILYEISLREDVVGLNKYVIVVSKIIDPADFNKLLRRVMKMMGNSQCGKTPCSDWLISKLYDLYKILGVAV